MNPARRFPRWSVMVAAGLLCALLAVSPFGDALAQPRPTSQPKPEGEMRWALYVTLSPVWFDPGEFQGLTSFWVLYAIHDALVKPMPGNLMTPSLAESWISSISGTRSLPGPTAGCGSPQAMRSIAAR